MSGVWLMLGGVGPLLGALLPGLDGSSRLLLAYGGATSIAFWPRSRRSLPCRRGEEGDRALTRRACPPLLVAGLLAGWLAHEPLCWVIGWTGLALGLEPWPIEPPLYVSPGTLLATLLLAPLFEERLYRGWLLTALSLRLGSTLALACSALLFALPHLQPWRILGTFVAGLLLGGVRIARGSLLLCVAIHAGLNAAALYPVSSWSSNRPAPTVPWSLTNGPPLEHARAGQRAPGSAQPPALRGLRSRLPPARDHTGAPP